MLIDPCNLLMYSCAMNTKTELSDTIIEIKNLRKTFGKSIALDGLDLKVKKGEVHGFLGPNGAGKSTTIRILLGMLKKTSGSVKLLDGDPWRDSTSLHRQLAYVPGDVNFWPNLTGGEIIDFIGSLRGGLDPKRREKLIERFELNPRKKFSTYSKGNRQKVALVAALASDVDLYIFDEPTSGLDPLMESVFQDEVIKLKQQGKTVLLSSHILAEVEALCDRITIIRKGKMVETGDLNDIRKKHRITMRISSQKPIMGLKGMAGIYDVDRSGNNTTFEIESIAMNRVLKLLATCDIDSLISEPPNLEHLFMSHYKEDK